MGLFNFPVLNEDSFNIIGRWFLEWGRNKESFVLESWRSCVKQGLD